MKNKNLEGLAFLFLPVFLSSCLPGAQKTELSVQAKVTGPDRLSALRELGVICDRKNDSSSTQLRRLSRNQYLESLKIILGPSAVQTFALTGSSLAFLPKDSEALHYPTMDKKVTNQHVDAYYRIGKSISEAIGLNDNILISIAGTCAVQTTVSPLCYQEFIKNFGLKAFRRPTTQLEVTQLESLFSKEPTSRLGFTSVIQSLLTSPNFTHEVISGEELFDRSSPDVYRLSSYELSTKLYFNVVGHSPDDFGFNIARKNSKLSPGDYEILVDHVFKLRDSNNELRLKATYDLFLSSWLEYRNLGEFNTSSQAVQDLAGPDLSPAKLQSHREDAERSVDLYVNHHFFENDSGFSEFLTSNKVFAVSETLKNIFKVPNVQDGFQLSSPNEARGLLLQPLFLYGGRKVAENDPFPRGNKLARNVLCKEIRFPTALDQGSLALPAFSADKTTRERFEAKTSTQSCMGCHKVINPMGFALEGFDVMGRYSRDQKIYDPTTLDFINTLPVNDTVTAEFISGRKVSISGGFPLVKSVDGSKIAHACFAKNLVSFATGEETKKHHACAVQAVYEHLYDNKPVRDSLRTLVMDESFLKIKRLK